MNNKGFTLIRTLLRKNLVSVQGFTLIRTLLRKNLVSVQGFTLIELLVVISVIGILATIVLVSFTGVQKQARDTARKSDLKQYQTAVEAFANRNNGFYPAGADVTLSPADNALCGDLGLTGCPVDPKDDTVHYGYWSNGTTGATATEYVLWSTLENPPAPATDHWVVCSNGKVGAGVAPTGSTCPLP